MTKGTEFEKQISRIYKLLENNSSEVTWNAKLPDPDNPKQPRQIDITIKKGGKITHVECRSRKNPQNTNWIEELMGRKISLEADMMIAVSDSGFTEGAILKAKKYGIFLRNLSEITIDEISKWGKTTAISIHYYVLTNISFRFTFENIKNISTQKVANELYEKSEYIDLLFNSLKYRFNSQRDIQFPYCFRLALQAHNMILCQEVVYGASVQGEVNEIVYKFNSPSVYEFLNKDDGDSSIAKIEKSKDIDIEIIKAGNGLAAIYFDLSTSPQAPPNSLLAGLFEFDSIPTKQGTTPTFSFIGSHEQKIHLVAANFSITNRDN